MPSKDALNQSPKSLNEWKTLAGEYLAKTKNPLEVEVLWHNGESEYWKGGVVRDSKGKSLKVEFANGGELMVDTAASLRLPHRVSEAIAKLKSGRM